MSISNKLEISDTDRKVGTFLVYACMFFLYVRPQEYVPGMHVLPIAGVLFLLLTIWGVFHIRTYLFKTPIVIIFLLGLVCLLSAFDAINVSAYKLAFKYVVQLFPQCLAIYILVDSKERIIKFIGWWCFIYLLVALITIDNGGLGPGDFTHDPNDAALALSIGIPFVFYSIWNTGLSKFQRIIRWGVLLIIVTAIIATQSRGGFLGLVSVFLVVWWFSKNRAKNAIMALVLGVVLGSIVTMFLPAGYLDEIQSINDPDDSTRVERFHMWEIGWIMYKDNPVIGVGARNFAWNAGVYQKLASFWDGSGEQTSLEGRVTHSLYFEVLPELGTIGAVLFLYMLVVAPLKLYRLRNNLPGNGEDQIFLKNLAQTLIAAMAGLAISGAFISVAYYPHFPVWITMYAIVMRHAESVRVQSTCS